MNLLIACCYLYAALFICNVALEAVNMAADVVKIKITTK